MINILASYPKFPMFSLIFETYQQIIFLKGWVLCDGSKIVEGPLINTYTPNLNAEGRFLRGGAATSQWTYQDHMMAQHGHQECTYFTGII